jgi:integrase
MNKYDFKSNFAERLNKFIGQKQALGCSYEGFNRYLIRFDEMCAEIYPCETELTREICMAWAIKKPTEVNNTFRNRMSPIREFAKFLVCNGENAFIIPVDLAKKSPRYLPYIYSKDEIIKIWNAYDLLVPVPTSPARHIVLPAIIRLLYCCGLRPAEARRLKVADVDLTKGRLFIRESKGHKDRIVMMAVDVANYIVDYNRKIKSYFPKREYFFPSPYGVLCSGSWLNDNWEKIRGELGFNAVCGNLPRIYDFRHTFATHRLYEWMREGKDLDAMLPYLSVYMGHAQLSDTYYYIHLVPGQFQTLSGFDFTKYEALIPEVSFNE